MSDSTKRFSSRVDNYIRYRPGYPAEIVDLLKSEYGLTSASLLADIGSGTGISTELFLKNGYQVIGVEPNKDMREAAERLLKDYPGFRSVAGTAEATSLEEHSVDFIIAGQAFHWFIRERTREEFIRILKPNGWVVLIWNDRKTEASPFLIAYEQLLKQFATDYEKVDHKQINPDVIRAFFETGTVSLHVFPNQQLFDLEGLKGRVNSSSYAPEPGHPNYLPLMNALKAEFAKYQVNGRVSFHYDTTVYCGRFD
ncbi:class I SAM-dependent methyltransferase [Pedosphaera parvula]|uniref:Methyltransferase type 11 n=1 Tax=Pedosphaera parvula (strain Ellin514) TaxID=320771 RepID=B9XSG5_PEDPL|nr:class I SAM-dependent methyltransferase [Pedosphaera parvula]EEF57230.1 Methyltransferase type 11 [Pedosphaera parvula Ellin514]